MVKTESGILSNLRNDLRPDAECDQVFLVLTIGASLIATFGLLANSPAVVIGAMLVAPWITPLRAAIIASLLSDYSLFTRALRSLFIGALLTIAISYAFGFAAESISLKQLSQEVLNRTSPNLLDLGIAIIAGFIAIFAKLRSEAVSSLAGTAIAVALVPPVCVVGITLSAHEWALSQNAAILYLTNLLGILIGGLISLKIFTGKESTQKLRISSTTALSIVLTVLILFPLTNEFIEISTNRKRNITSEQIEKITAVSFQSKPEIEAESEAGGATLQKLSINWTEAKPTIRAYISASDPKFVSSGVVQQTEDQINEQVGKKLNTHFELIVKKTIYEIIPG
ncbi:MAG: DUF389 domain-containing protein [Cyanobium sp. NAT70]|nr:DUF389 domain-containing protein [Cyanobium sp. NAT70]|tara:strand:- start:972 stop:1991 length:1020 start_codon:yes stop_codon:yes gene_type:complete